jgi:ABC-type Fe3+-citrate transport system substrate-binding protein
MNEYIKVEGKDGLVRDIKTRAIINTNKSDYQNYLNQVASVKEKQRKIEEHSQDINNIKAEISDIKQMLLMLINKGS